MMNNPNRRSVSGFFFLGLLEEASVEQEAANNAETWEQEQVEPRGWALKWDGVALSQVRGERTGFGPFARGWTHGRNVMDHDSHSG